MTWLDDYTFRMGSLYREEEVDTEGDVQDVMQDVSEMLLEGIRDDGTTGTLVANGPDADLYVFFSRVHLHLRQGFRVEPALVAKLRQHVPSQEELTRFLDHIFHRRRFVYVDFPDGGLRFGDVEVKAVVVKSTHMFKGWKPDAVPYCLPIEFAPRFDVVVGRPGVPTRNRITFDYCNTDQVDEVVKQEGRAYPSIPTPLEMLVELDRHLVEINDEIQMTVINAILHAERYAGTRHAKPIPCLRDGDTWRTRDAPHPRKTLFQGFVNLIDVPGVGGRR